jgi:hypothetical protein
LRDELDVATIGEELAFSTSGDIVFTGQGSETPLLGDDDLLLTGELVLAASQGFDDGGLVRILGTDREDDLTNVDTSDQTVGLTESTTHTSLQSIGTSARQHFVDTDNVEGMDTDTHVEGVFTRGLGHVLVTTDTASFKGFSRQLFVFVGHQVDTEREVIDMSLLATQIVDSDLGIGDTTAVTRLGVRLVLTITVTASRTATHFTIMKKKSKLVLCLYVWVVERWTTNVQECEEE